MDINKGIAMITFTRDTAKMMSPMYIVFSVYLFVFLMSGLSLTGAAIVYLMTI